MRYIAKTTIVVLAFLWYFQFQMNDFLHLIKPNILVYIKYYSSDYMQHNKWYKHDLLDQYSNLGSENQGISIKMFSRTQYYVYTNVLI